MFSRLLPFCATLVLGLSPYSLSAQDSDPKLDELRGIITKMQSDFENAIKGFGKVIKRGDINIENQGSYYAVTSPHYSIEFMNGSKFDFGMVAVNVLPHINEGQWKMAHALPTPMSIINSDGNIEGQLSIGGQRSACLFDTAFGYCSKLDQSFTNLSFKNPEETKVVNLPEVNVSNVLTKTDRGYNTWSGPTYFKAKNLNLVDAGNEFMRIGEISASAEMFDFDATAFKEANKAMEEMGLYDPVPDLDLSSPDKQKVFKDRLSNTIDKMLQSYGNGFTSEFTISDFSFQYPKPGPDDDNFALKLGKANYGIDMVGFLDNDVSFDARFGYDGIDITPLPEEFSKITPTTLKIDTSLQNIPFKDIYTMTKDGMSNANDPSAIQMMGMSLLFRLPGLLSQAGTKLVIEDNYIGNENFMVKINGEGVADIQALKGGTADVTIAITGFDFLTQEVQAEISKNPSGSNAGQLQSIAMGLGMLQGFADVQTGADGQPLHNFKIVLNKQGQITVNGQDVSALAGGAMPTPQ